MDTNKEKSIVVTPVSEVEQVINEIVEKISQSLGDGSVKQSKQDTKDVKDDKDIKEDGKCNKDISDSKDSKDIKQEVNQNFESNINSVINGQTQNVNITNYFLNSKNIKTIKEDKLLTNKKKKIHDEKSENKSDKKRTSDLDSKTFDPEKVDKYQIANAQLSDIYIRMSEKRYNKLVKDIRPILDENGNHDDECNCYECYKLLKQKYSKKAYNRGREKLRNEILEQTEEIKTYEKQINELTLTIIRFKTENKRLKAENKSFKTENEKLKSQNDVLVSTLNTRNKQELPL